MSITHKLDRIKINYSGLEAKPLSEATYLISYVLSIARLRAI